MSRRSGVAAKADTFLSFVSSQSLIVEFATRSYGPQKLPEILLVRSGSIPALCVA